MKTWKGSRMGSVGIIRAEWLVALALVMSSSWSIAQDTGTISGTVDNRRVRRAAAVIYVEKIPGKEFPVSEIAAVMDQIDLAFTPHVLPVQVGGTVDFPNSDSVRHSVFSSRRSAQQMNLGTYDAGVTRHIQMDTVGATTLLCNVHAEMSGYLITVETPFFTTTDADGRFEIANVPAGTHSLTIWHERLETTTLEDVVVNAGETTEVVFEGVGNR